eukprot:SM000035S13122  [mRNA]  locus=s35:568635:575842:- [translate_table: standard]
MTAAAEPPFPEAGAFRAGADGMAMAEADGGRPKPAVPPLGADAASSKTDRPGAMERKEDSAQLRDKALKATQVDSRLFVVPLGKVRHERQGIAPGPKKIEAGGALAPRAAQRQAGQKSISPAELRALIPVEFLEKAYGRHPQQMSLLQAPQEHARRLAQICDELGVKRRKPDKMSERMARILYAETVLEISNIDMHPSPGSQRSPTLEGRWQNAVQAASRDPNEIIPLGRQKLPEAEGKMEEVVAGVEVAQPQASAGLAGVGSPDVAEAESRRSPLLAPGCSETQAQKTVHPDGDIGGKQQPMLVEASIMTLNFFSIFHLPSSIKSMQAPPLSLGSLTEEPPDRYQNPVPRLSPAAEARAPSVTVVSSAARIPSSASSASTLHDGVSTRPVPSAGLQVADKHDPIDQETETFEEPGVVEPVKDYQWMGDVQVVNQGTGSPWLRGVKARVASTAVPKVFEVTRGLPSPLQVQQLKRGEDGTWRNKWLRSKTLSFDTLVAFYLFPASCPVEDFKARLISLADGDLLWRVELPDACLLILPSTLVPPPQHGSLYLWGMYKAKSAKQVPRPIPLQEAEVEPESRVQARNTQHLEDVTHAASIPQGDDSHDLQTTGGKPAEEPHGVKDLDAGVLKERKAPQMAVDPAPTGQSAPEPLRVKHPDDAEMGVIGSASSQPQVAEKPPPVEKPPPLPVSVLSPKEKVTVVTPTGPPNTTIPSLPPGFEKVITSAAARAATAPQAVSSSGMVERRDSMKTSSGAIVASREGGRAQGVGGGSVQKEVAIREEVDTAELQKDSVPKLLQDIDKRGSARSVGLNDHHKEPSICTANAAVGELPQTSKQWSGLTHANGSLVREDERKHRSWSPRRREAETRGSNGSRVRPSKDTAQRPGQGRPSWSGREGKGAIVEDPRRKTAERSECNGGASDAVPEDGGLAPSRGRESDGGPGARAAEVKQSEWFAGDDDTNTGTWGTVPRRTRAPDQGPPPYVEFRIGSSPTRHSPPPSTKFVTLLDAGRQHGYQRWTRADSAGRQSVEQPPPGLLPRSLPRMHIQPAHHPVSNPAERISSPRAQPSSPAYYEKREVPGQSHRSASSSPLSAAGLSLPSSDSSDVNRCYGMRGKELQSSDSSGRNLLQGERRGREDRSRSNGRVSSEGERRAQVHERYEDKGFYEGPRRGLEHTSSSRRGPSKSEWWSSQSHIALDPRDRTYLEHLERDKEKVRGSRQDRGREETTRTRERDNCEKRRRSLEQDWDTNSEDSRRQRRRESANVRVEPDKHRARDGGRPGDEGDRVRTWSAEPVEEAPWRRQDTARPTAGRLVDPRLARKHNREMRGPSSAEEKEKLSSRQELRQVVSKQASVALRERPPEAKRPNPSPHSAAEEGRSPARSTALGASAQVRDTAKVVGTSDGSKASCRPDREEVKKQEQANQRGHKPLRQSDGAHSMGSTSMDVDSGSLEESVKSVPAMTSAPTYAGEADVEVPNRTFSPGRTSLTTLKKPVASAGPQLSLFTPLAVPNQVATNSSARIGDFDATSGCQAAHDQSCPPGFFKEPVLGGKSLLGGADVGQAAPQASPSGRRLADLLSLAPHGRSNPPTEALDDRNEEINLTLTL